MPFVIFVAIAIVSAGLRLAFSNQAHTVHQIVEIFLIHMLIISVGLGGIFAFLGHIAKADEIAKEIGWPAGNPFQKEVASANLAFGILGILSFWLRGDFLVATGIGFSVYVFGCGIVHIADLATRGNRSPLNSGAIVYFDILMPLLVAGLVIADKAT